MGFFNGLAKGLQSRSMFEEDKRARRSDEEYREWQKGMSEREFGLKERELDMKYASAAAARRKQQIQQANQLSALAGSLGLSGGSVDLGEPTDTQMGELSVSSSGGSTRAAASGGSYDPRGESTMYSGEIEPAPSEGPKGLPYSETPEGWTAGRMKLRDYMSESMFDVPLEEQEKYANIFQTVLSDEETSAQLWDIVESYRNAGVPLTTEDILARVQLTDARITPEQRRQYAAQIFAVKAAEMQDQRVPPEAYSRALRAEAILANTAHGLELNFDTSGLMPLEYEDRQKIFTSTAEGFNRQALSWMASHLPNKAGSAYDTFLTADEEGLKAHAMASIMTEHGAQMVSDLMGTGMFKREHLLNNPYVDPSVQDYLKEAVAGSDEAIVIEGQEAEEPEVIEVDDSGLPDTVDISNMTPETRDRWYQDNVINGDFKGTVVFNGETMTLGLPTLDKPDERTPNELKVDADALREEASSWPEGTTEWTERMAEADLLDLRAELLPYEAPEGMGGSTFSEDTSPSFFSKADESVSRPTLSKIESSRRPKLAADLDVSSDRMVDTSGPSKDSEKKDIVNTIGSYNTLLDMGDAVISADAVALMLDYVSIPADSTQGNELANMLTQGSPEDKKDALEFIQNMIR